jgi:IS30 family transposase
LAILKIQVHRDRGEELADNRRFTLATNIEVYFCDPQSPWQRGSKFEEGPLLAQSGR